MKTLWSTIKVCCLGLGALTCALLGQAPAQAQKVQPPKQPVQKQPVPKQTQQPQTSLTLRVGTAPQNKTLSNYYSQAANPNNPFNPTNQGQIQNQLYYQGLANQQLNTVTGILGNNLAPLVGNSGGLFGAALAGNNGGLTLNFGGLGGQFGFGQGGYGGMPAVVSGQPFQFLTGRGQPMIAGQQGMMMNYMGMNPMMAMGGGMNPMMMGGMNPMMMGSGMNPMMMGGMNPMMTGGMNPMMMGMYGSGGMNPMMMGMYGPGGMNPMMGMYGPGGANPLMMGGGTGGMTPAAGMGGMMLPVGF